MRRLMLIKWIPLFLSPLVMSCGMSDPQSPAPGDVIEAGVLPSQTPDLTAEEWNLYRAAHPELDESQAHHQFDAIQIMSAEKYDARIAAWAERRALAESWFKTQIEDVFHPKTVDDNFIRQAIDAYAFKSGHPALITVSHVLIRKDGMNSAETRRGALEAVRGEIAAGGDYSDDVLRAAAERLMRAGFRTDMNSDLTFPKEVMTSFMGEQLNYRNMVEPFANAAFLLSEDNPLSPVVETEFGHHIIAFRKIEPGVKAELEKDREFMRSNIVLQGRKMAVRQYVEELMKSSELLINEAEVSKIAGMGQPAEEASQSK